MAFEAVVAAYALIEVSGVESRSFTPLTLVEDQPIVYVYGLGTASLAGVVVPLVTKV
jgi:hypothetical protein